MKIETPLLRLLRRAGNFKRPICRLRTMLGLVLVAGLFAMPVSAQVTVFPQCDFLGGAVSLPEGEYTQNELLGMGLQNGKIGSLIVTDGFTAEIYTGSRFDGKSGKLTQLNRCIEESRYRESASSVAVYQTNAGSMASSDANTDTEMPDGVQLFTECNYSGRSATLSVGKYMATDLAALGLGDNSISSVRVPEGMKIDLFENDFYRGSSGALQVDSDCLVDRFNDVVSSVIVSGEALNTAQQEVQSDLPPVVVFDRCNFRGNGARLTVGDYTAKDLLAAGIADNTIASIQVPEGMELLIFENDFQRGKSHRVKASARCLTGTQFADMISSVNVVPTAEETFTPEVNPNNERATIYTKCNYRGRFAELPAGSYRAGDLAQLGFTDNTISAITVPPTLRVTVYENDNYGGGSLVLEEDVSCLSTRRADDAISSLVIESVDARTPEQKPMSSMEKRRLQEGFDCVTPYVQKNLCNKDSWGVVTDFCSLNEVPLMSDGYLESHVKAGNCTIKNWPELQKRIANAALR